MIADKYWRELGHKLRKYEFTSEQMEIKFFKIWKPCFTSEIEYYNLVNHSLLFQPKEFDTAIHFWGREYKRLEKLTIDQKEFLECYYNKNCHMTMYYFLRKYYEQRNILDGKIYDADASIMTNGDSLVASLLALERYKQYAEEQLRNLPTNELKE